MFFFSRASGSLLTSFLNEAMATFTALPFVLLREAVKEESSPFSGSSITWQRDSAPETLQLMPSYLKRSARSLPTFPSMAPGERSPSLGGNTSLKSQSQAEVEES